MSSRNRGNKDSLHLFDLSNDIETFLSYLRPSLEIRIYRLPPEKPGFVALVVDTLTTIWRSPPYWTRNNEEIMQWFLTFLRCMHHFQISSQLPHTRDCWTKTVVPLLSLFPPSQSHACIRVCARLSRAQNTAVHSEKNASIKTFSFIIHKHPRGSSL